MNDKKEKKEKSNFIGLGENPNPNVPDLPIGLGMALSQSDDARAFYDTLSEREQTMLIKYVQTGNKTGADAKNKIYDVIFDLKNHNIDFLNKVQV